MPKFRKKHTVSIFRVDVVMQGSGGIYIGARRKEC
jgi:hypothetical protein